MKKVLHRVAALAILIAMVLSIGNVALAQAPTITVSVTPSSLVGSGVVSLKITLTNPGDTAITNVRLYYPTTAREEIALGDLAPGESREYTNDWIVPAELLDQPISFTVAWVEADGTSKTGTAPSITIAKKDPTIAATAKASASADKVKKGESVLYKFELTNTGDVDFTNVTLTAAPLNEGKTLVDPFTLGPGATQSIEWEVTLDQTTEISPVFYYTANGQAMKSVTNKVGVTVDVPKAALMRLTARPDKTTVAAGDEVTFQMTLSNTGSANLTAISVKDFNGGTVMMARNTLNAGETTTGEVTLAVPATGNYVFTATARDEEGNATSAESDAVAITATDATPESLNPASIVSITATATNPTLTGPGDAEFLVTVQNLSTETLKNVVMQETSTGASNIVPELEAGQAETWSPVLPIEDTTEYFFTVSVELDDGTIIRAEATPTLVTIQQEKGLTMFQTILIIFICAIAGVAIALGIFVSKGKKQAQQNPENGKAVPPSARAAQERPQQARPQQQNHPQNGQRQRVQQAPPPQQAARQQVPQQAARQQAPQQSRPRQVGRQVGVQQQPKDVHFGDRNQF